MAERAQPPAVEFRARIQADPDPRGALPGGDAAEQDSAVRIAGKR